MHGTGNDFVVLPDLDGALELDASLTARLCRPHLGLGADGVIRLAPARTAADDVFMDYRNADGSVAEMCGNGVRCVAKYLVDRGLVTGDEVRVDTRGGTKVVEVTARHADGTVADVRVDMGVPVPGEVDVTVDVGDGPPFGADGAVRLTTVSMGNPHAVVVVNDPDRFPLAALAARLRGHELFPDGVNVEVITVASRTRVRGRIHERGVGETLSSGTGSSAMAVAAMLLELVDRRVEVTLPGGALGVDWTGAQLLVTGPAVEVARGTLDDAWLTTP